MKTPAEWLYVRPLTISEPITLNGQDLHVHWSAREHPLPRGQNVVVIVAQTRAQIATAPANWPAVPRGRVPGSANPHYTKS